RRDLPGYPGRAYQAPHLHARRRLQRGCRVSIRRRRDSEDRPADVQAGPAMSGLPRTALAMLLLALAWWSPRAEALTTCTASSTLLAFGSTDGAAGKDTTAGVVVTCSTTAISLLSTVRVRMCLN